MTDDPPVTDETPGLPPSLTPDSIATTLGGDIPGVPLGYVSFKGYLAEGNGGVHRLYIDDTFWSWLEVPAADIAARLDVPSNAADARSVIWVNRDARVTKCQVGYAPDLEDEGWGGDPVALTRRRRPPY